MKISIRKDTSFFLNQIFDISSTFINLVNRYCQKIDSFIFFKKSDLNTGVQTKSGSDHP